MNNLKYFYIMGFIFVAELFGVSVSYASVSAENTRIIYPAGAASKSFTLTNDDDFPNIVQIWMDDGDILTQPNTSQTPFFVTPSIFRISPRNGQTIKIIHNGSDLPTDRESLFYFNYLQIPPQMPDKADKNKITLLFRHRLKLFYRPANLKEDIHKVNTYQQATLTQNKKDWLLTVYNNSGYYANYTETRIELADNSLIECIVETVEPYSSKTISISGKGVLPKGKKTFHFSLINDQGGQKTDKLIITN